MSGFFGADSSGDTEAERIARGMLDPKGALTFEREYFRDRVSNLSSSHADEQAMTEGFSDYWIYRERTVIPKEKKENYLHTRKR